mmetsp:Transcript_9216/g.30412  ORF Transcript_9216/g.30412 Transcript_9216/m.30412 type:complete len:168 (+) Transcript_9216:177-680(+)
MKPDWDKLGNKYAESDTTIIVDVDCTAPESESLCQRFGVKGYPTLKYFVAGDKSGKAYEQGRDFASMESFVKSKLSKPSCNIATKKGCKENEIAFIEKNEGKSPAELAEEQKAKKEEIKAMKKEWADAEKEFKAKEKEWKKKEALLTKASQLLGQLEKAAKAAKKDL